MKRKHAAVAKTLAASVFISSCSPNVEVIEQFEESISDKEKIDESNGVPITLTLSEETKRELLLIKPIIDEIINKPEVAHEFAKDPNMFCKKRGYELTFELDDAMYNVIVALGNREINKALNENDIEKFMSVCNEQNLFSKEQTVRLNTIFQSEEEQRIFDSIANQLNSSSTVTRGVAMFAVLTVVIVIAIMLAYTVGPTTDTDNPGQQTFEADEEESPKDKDTEESEVDDHQIIKNKDSLVNTSTVFLHSYPNQSVLDLWALKNKDIKDFQLVSSYKSLLIKQVIDYLKVHNPQTFENFSENQVTEFFKRNMIV